jgi:CubicO group peptidase (beta-lactamase class C family)
VSPTPNPIAYGEAAPPTASDLGLMQGSPPPPDRIVTHKNWELPPFNRWAFQNMPAVFPTGEVDRGLGVPRDLGPARWTLDTLQLRVGPSVREVLDATYTDGIVVLHRGKLMLEHYANGMSATTLHMCASITKSVLGTIAGVMVSRGQLNVRAPVKDYLPELASSSFADATVQQVLDMNTGTKFSEDYEDPDAEIRIKGQADGWDFRRDATVPDTIYDFLRTTVNDRPHGERWAYRSCITDVLGWMLERLSGLRLPRFISHEVWSRIGAAENARCMLGPTGNALYDGCLLATTADLARFGLALGEGSLAPESFITDTLRGDEACRSAWLASDVGRRRFPAGHYRNQIWVPDAAGQVLLGVGVYGQYLWVDTARDVVVAKFSSLPQASRDHWREAHLSLFERIAAHCEASYPTT